MATGALLAGLALPGEAARRPGLITSAGQSSDAVIVNVLANSRLKLDLRFAQLARPADLNGVRTLLVVVGFSSKGLGEAGIKEEEEFARVQALLDKARSDGIEVILIHSGGAARRGANSDRLIDLVAPYASTMLVVEAGNRDGRFDRLAARYGAKLVQVPRVTDLAGPLAELFKES